LIYHSLALNSVENISTSLSKDNEEERPVHTGKIIIKINATSIIIIVTQLKLRFS